MHRRILHCLIVAFVVAGMPAGPGIAAQETTAADALKRGSTGLRLPRFASLKSNRVNVRKGPSTDHAVAWVFSRVGLPVEITAESGNWRRIRDSESSDGWVFHSLLSGRRTVLVMPWVEDNPIIPLYRDRSTSAGLIARLRPGVLASVLTCNGSWCNISLDAYSGWIEQEKLWGVYGGEIVN